MQRGHTPGLSSDLHNVHFDSAYRAPVAPMFSLYSESSAMDIDQQEDGTMVTDKMPDSIALTAPPNSPQQPLNAYLTLQQPNEKPQHTVILKDLFGPQGPSFPVEGSQTALRLLANAISQGLAVLNTPADGDVIVESALFPIQARGAAPDYHEEGILELRHDRPVELAALGLTADQFTLSPEEAKVLYTASTPFLSQLASNGNHFDVAKVLVLLKVFARYWQHTEKRYQLLVVTNAKPHVLEAELFCTQQEPNETIFLFRKLKYNGFVGGAPSYEETWKPISLPPSAPRPARELDVLGRPLRKAFEQTPMHHRPKVAKKSKSPAPAPPVDEPRERARPIHSGIDITTYQGMTPNQVFETVQKELAAGTLHPDAVSGERLLLFAVAYSNQEIRDLLLPYNRQYNQTLASSNLVYNGRILPAIRKSRRPGQSFDKAKANFDEARKANDLVTTSAIRGVSTRADKPAKVKSHVSRKRKRTIEPAELEGDEPEPDMSDEETDDESCIIATPAARRTRGAKPPASYRIIVDEDSEDEEMVDVQPSEQDGCTRAIHKRAKMNNEEDDDEDADFELDV